MPPLSIYFVRVLLIALLSSGPSLCRAEETDANAISFSRDVRPILSAKCYFCHGPDPDKREADLRLDRADNALAERDGDFAIVPGKPEQSELWKRISSDDEFTQMPPPESNRTLSDREKQILKTWIEQGAKYETHWAFAPPKQAEPPKVDDAKWSKNPIDRFVYPQILAAGLVPNYAADRLTLARRVYLDLIGLPPTIEQADRFANDPRPDAYEHLVEELLASTHYGERWARRWLDLARYSDTNGYEKDRPREMSAYRDWVIEAINDDMPFDRFTIEQLAGDMLPKPTEAQLIATGFHRNTMINEEGGVDPQEFRFLAMVDRVNTTGTTWLGLTVGCAQCHTHKYDPLTQTEYYQMMAFLNNADEPTVEIADPEVAAQREAIEQQIAAAKGKLATQFPLPEAIATTDDVNKDELRQRHLHHEFQTWLQAQRAALIDWKNLRPQQVETNLPNATVLEDNSILISGDQTKNDIFTIDLKTELDTLTGIRLEAIPDKSLPFGGPGRSTINAGVEKGGEFYVSEIYFKVATKPEAELTERKVTEAKHSFSREKRSAEFTLDRKSDTGWSIAPRMKERHTATYRFAEPIEKQDGPIRLQVRIEHQSFHPSGLGRFRLAATNKEGELAAFDRPAEIERLVAIPKQELNEKDEALLRQYFLETTPLLEDQHKKIAKLEKSLPDMPTTLVMQERPERFPRTTARHHRGEFLNPREEVTPDVPEFLHSFPEDQTPNRLNFARWLVSENNPLTARVVMNRQWEAFFGRGLVKTAEDFGMQGELPTHPKLLDWLAVELMNRGWSRKAMHRLIVTSATYRQNPKIDLEKLAVDPENVLLARAPRVRLEAELVRDNVLAISGLLSDKIGGPSVFPPQPPGITEVAYGSLQWQVSKGEDRYRRGLYTFNKRTAPYTMFSTFDAPSGELCLARRDPSNTPLQSLTTLNSTVFMEAAQNLALEILQGDLATESQRLNRLFRRAMIRKPTFHEVIELSGFLDTARETIEARNAHAIVGAGIVKRWDFNSSEENWQAAKLVELVPTEKVLRITSTGEDPVLRTEISAPSGTLTLTLRANFPAKGQAQVFWMTEKQTSEDEKRSVHLETEPGWKEYTVTIAASDTIRSLRFDPASEKGVTELDWMKLSIGSGSRTVPEGIDVREWAAWTTLARAILNLDETITKP